MRIPSVIVPVLLIILSVVGAASAAAAEYSAPSRIVYVCGKDLCTVDPATKAKSRLTKDGAGYGYPSVSLDGHRLAVLRGANVVAGEVGADPSQDFGAIRGLKDVAITPDGAAVATSYWYSEDKLVYRYRYTCGGACLVLETVYTSGASYSPSPGTEGSALQGTSGVGFLGGALLSTGGQAGSYDSATENLPRRHRDGLRHRHARGERCSLPRPGDRTRVADHRGSAAKLLRPGGIARWALHRGGARDRLGPRRRAHHRQPRR